MNLNTIENIDCLVGLKKLPDNSIDSIVTDPPYGIRFMGKGWDYDVPSVEIWKECLRVLKPGGHALIACGTRTQHRMVVNIEDAGFEVRDVITWHYGSGFPKSMDISKAIDKQAGAEREVMGEKKKLQSYGYEGNNVFGGDLDRGGIQQITAPATEEAKQWEGWGTALKPSTEFWTLVRKPVEGTVAENVLKYGTGGINIDGCRIGTEERTYKGMSANKPEVGTFRDDNWIPKDIEVTVNGRFPANLILDPFTASLLDEQSGITKGTGKPTTSFHKPSENTCMSGANLGHTTVSNIGDSGGASRFFYVAKPSQDERGDTNIHPTVKPLELMQYLIKLITPPQGIVIDPFCGSGTTLIAASLLGFDFIGYEISPEYIEIIKRRFRDELGMFNKLTA